MGYDFVKKKIEYVGIDSNKSRKLIWASFPKAEAPSFKYFLKYANNENVDFTAYYLDDEYIGFTYVLKSKNLAYLLYFAVQPNKRSKGIGSAIVEDLISSSKDKSIVIDIEEIDEKASNNQLRIRRHNLYERLGFKDTGYIIYDYSGRYTVMATGDDFDIKEYQSLFSVFPECLGECLIENK